jgi:hypothetical protein
MTMHWICGVEYESGYRLRLTFEDGNARIVDLQHHLDGEMFEPLRDTKQFRKARLNPDLDTVVWENGADMSPDFLYEIGVPVEAADKRTLCVAEGKAKYGKGP